MKTIIGTIILVLYCSTALMAQQFQYYYGDKPVLLELNPSHAYLVLDGVDDPQKLQDLLPGVEITKFGVHNPGQTLNAVPGSDFVGRGLFWAEVSLSQPLGQKAYQKWLDDLQQMPSVRLASPYFANENSDKIGLSDLFLVKLQEMADPAKLQEIARSNGVHIVGQNRFMPEWYTLAVDKASRGNALEMANLFYETGLFVACEPDLMTDDLGECVNDPLFNTQWGLRNTGQNGGTSGIDINACNGWANWTTGSSSVVIAILDHGFERNHPDLAGNNVGTGFDTESGTSPALVLGSHGTACAGIAGAVTNNNLGVAGVARNCGLMSISNSLAGTPNSRQKRADGINWAWQNGAAVISNSWSSGVQYTVIDNAITSALNNGRGGLGTVICFSAGNGNGAVSYPANSNPDIVVVGAMSPCAERKTPTSCDGEYWWGSDFGNQLDVMAPGVLIQTTDRQGANGYNNAAGTAGDYYAIFNGTSSACPHVAGLAGLIISMNPCLTHDQVEDIIEKSARKVGGYSYTTTAGRPNGTWDNEMGYGLIDVDAALQMTRELYFQNQTVSVTETHQVYGNIYAGANVTTAVPSGNYVVASGGNVSFRASNGISLEAGFSVQAGGIFNAIIVDDSDCDDWLNIRRAPTGPVAQVEAVEAEDSNVQLDQPNPGVVGELVAYPNPFSDRITLHYTLAEQSGQVDIRLYNVQGSLVATLADQEDQDKGAHEKSVSLAREMPDGIYLLRVSVNGQVKTLKMLKN